METQEDNIQNLDESEENYLEEETKNAKIQNNTGLCPLQKLVQWNRSATLLLLKIYKDHLEEFISPHTKKKNVWEKVASILNEKYQLGVTALQCENKLKNLSLSYKKAVDANRKRTHFKNSFLFKQMDELYRREKEIVQTPPNLTSKMLPATLIKNFSEEDNISLYKTINYRSQRTELKRKLNETLPWGSLLEGIERQHTEKMAKYDKIIEILEKIVDRS